MDSKKFLRVLDNSSFTSTVDENDATKYNIESASGYYIGGPTSDANGMQTSTSVAYQNTITFNSGDAHIVSPAGPVLRYNYAKNSWRFRYFKTATYSSQRAIQLYIRKSRIVND